MTVKIKRLDKRVSCRKCYYTFWQDAKLPKMFYQCPRCNSLEIDIVKEYGKPVIELREYEI